METKSQFVGKKNRHGQIIILHVSEAQGPHLDVTWYLAGMWEGCVTAIRAGETDEQAAQRILKNKAHKVADWRRVELTDC